MGKVAVGVLGATGAVGQRFVQLLADHPWFEVAEVAASDRSAGKPYRDACTWRLGTPMPESAAARVVKTCNETFESKLLFSGLDSSVAGEVETALANKGHAVVSNSRNHRMDPDVPLLIPEVNPDHLDALAVQRKRTGGGYIVTNPNCSVVGLAMALAPLQRAFGLTEVAVVTLQALSGAGYPGVASMDIADNVIPYIGGGEEEKIETEPLRILGTLRRRRLRARALPHLRLRAPRGRHRRPHHGRLRAPQDEGHRRAGGGGPRRLPRRAAGAQAPHRAAAAHPRAARRRTGRSRASTATSRAGWRCPWAACARTSSST